MIEDWNRAVFLALNASATPAPSLVLVATIIAQDVIFIVPLILAALWLWGSSNGRSGLLLAFCAAEVALGFNQIAALLWYHPRPFAVPIGHTLVEHVADSSFPSDHVTFLVAAGLGVLAWSHHRWAGLLILGLALPVAWSRLFLGLHFPLDMIGAVPVACAGVLALLPARRWVDQVAMVRWIEPLYRWLFSVPIRRGWVRS